MQWNEISSNQLKNIENEILVLEKANHPNIVKMVDRMKSKNHYYLILEYCNGGDLASYIEQVKKVSEDEGRLIIK